MSKFEFLSASELVLACPIEIGGDRVEIDVRQVIPTELEGIAKRCTSRRPGPGGRMEDKIDQELYLPALADAYIRGWRFLKVEHLSMIGLPPKDPAAIPVDENGFVRFDADLARIMFSKGQWGKFGEPIQSFSANLQELARAQEKARLGN